MNAKKRRVQRFRIQQYVARAVRPVSRKLTVTQGLSGENHALVPYDRLVCDPVLARLKEGQQTVQMQPETGEQKPETDVIRWP